MFAQVDFHGGAYKVHRREHGVLCAGNASTKKTKMAAIVAAGNGPRMVSAVATMDEVAGFTALSDYFNSAYNQKEVNNQGQGTYRAYHVLDDMPGITNYLGVIYVGMLSGKLHWMNRELGLPAILTDKIYTSSTKVRWDNIVPSQVPAMGVPRIGRSVVEEVVSKAENWTLSFIMEDEHFGQDTGNIELTRNLMYIAGKMAEFMSIEAYRALHFCKSVRGVSYNAGNDEETFKMSVMDECDRFAMPHKSADGLQRLSELCINTLVTGSSHVRPDLGVVPIGKLGALIGSNPLYMEYYRAGQSGPKRIRAGFESDLDSGDLNDGNSGPMLVNGIRLMEGPAIDTNSGYTHLFSRVVYTGEFMNFTTPQDSYLGTVGSSALPMVKVFSAKEDDWMPVGFEEAFVNCGRFVRVPGSANGNAPHNQDQSKHLWMIDVNAYVGMTDADLPKDVTDANADPFVYMEGNALKIRPWAQSPLRSDYYDDLPDYHQLETFSSDDYLRVEAQEAREDFDPAAQGGWPAGLYAIRLRMAENDKKIVWNKNLKILAAAALTAVNTGIADAALNPTRAEVGDLYRASPTRSGLQATLRARTMLEWSKLLDFILVRAAVGTRMQDIPFYKAGAVGNTMCGRTRHSITQTNGNNSWLVRADCRIGVHIQDDDAVCVARNAIYHGIVSGSDARVMTVQQAQDLANNGFQMDASHPSIHSICIPKVSVRWNSGNGAAGNSYDYHRTMIATAGTLPIVGNNGANTTPHYPGYRFYNRLYQFFRLAVHSLEGQDLAISPILIRGGVQYPTINGFREERSKGHHGYEAPGVRETRSTGRRLLPSPTKI